MTLDTWRASACTWRRRLRGGGTNYWAATRPWANFLSADEWRRVYALQVAASPSSPQMMIIQLQTDDLILSEPPGPQTDLSRGPGLRLLLISQRTSVSPSTGLCSGTFWTKWVFHFLRSLEWSLHGPPCSSSRSLRCRRAPLQGSAS